MEFKNNAENREILRNLGVTRGPSIDLRAHKLVTAYSSLIESISDDLREYGLEVTDIHEFNCAISDNYNLIDFVDDIDSLADLSCDWQEENREVGCDISLKIDGVTYEAYSVSICHRDLLFTFNEGTATYLVDTYGNENTYQLVELNLDSNNE